jgi:acetolactate synthase-1/2/3 large subunit
MERGAGLPLVQRLPYFADAALELTRQYSHVVLAGTRRPVAFFGYPGLPSYLTSAAQTVELAGREDDVLGALEALAHEVHAGDEYSPVVPARPKIGKGAIDAEQIAAVIAALQPENCIVMDEALTAGIGYFAATAAAPRFTHLMLTGGAIGQGPGAATGAALAAPGRKVINFQSDGCGAYSVQAFWTQAREALDVVTVIASNRSYNILDVELARAGITQRGPAQRTFIGLDRPNLDWVRIAEGFGVPAVAVDTVEALAQKLELAITAKGPWLIEAIMS